jgi:hypothetical protein
MATAAAAGLGCLAAGVATLQYPWSLDHALPSLWIIGAGGALLGYVLGRVAEAYIARR